MPRCTWKDTWGVESGEGDDCRAQHSRTGLEEGLRDAHRMKGKDVGDFESRSVLSTVWVLSIDSGHQA